MSRLPGGFIKKRRTRKRLIYQGFHIFSRGDVLSMHYRLVGYGHAFTGICMRVKKKAMISPDTSFLLRNIFVKVAVEVSGMLYTVCRMTFKLMDYARKQFYYKRSKLYYLRVKLNKESWVKC